MNGRKNLEILAIDEMLYGFEVATRLAIERKKARERLRVLTDPIRESAYLTEKDYMIRITI